jgi:hypothetical protein
LTVRTEVAVSDAEHYSPAHLFDACAYGLTREKSADTAVPEHHVLDHGISCG